jgi:alpha-ribazole phosphatase
LIAKHPDETVVVVSHGAAIRTILCHALGMSLANVWSIRQDNTAVNKIAYYTSEGARSSMIVELVNDAGHLRG